MFLRDQTSLRPHILEKSLRGLSAEEWLGLLNDRVFFWLDPRRLEQLLAAGGTRGRPHDVLTVDTASLVRRRGERIRLSPINSGAALYPGAPPGGLCTLSTIEDYLYAEWRHRRPRHAAIAELAVVGGVPDIADHVVSVQRISEADSSLARPAVGRP